jgi:DNA-binding NarL/FixJ family response regulator
MLDDTDVVVVPAPTPDGVVLSAAHTVTEALAAHPPSPRVVVMADAFTRDDVVCALRAGVSTLLQTSRTTTAQLASALHAVRDGDGRMPHEVLVRILGGAANPDGRSAPPPRLTTHQVAVLRLVADGLGNAGIARTLSCSEHTVKNVIYELMSRLHARNRAHAVASAVRQGLI